MLDKKWQKKYDDRERDFTQIRARMEKNHDKDIEVMKEEMSQEVPALKRLLEEAHVKYEELKKEMSRAVAKEKQAMQVGGSCMHVAHAFKDPAHDACTLPWYHADGQLHTLKWMGLAFYAGRGMRIHACRG
jgi:hypothetical protein